MPRLQNLINLVSKDEKVTARNDLGNLDESSYKHIQVRGSLVNKRSGTLYNTTTAK